MLYRSIGVVEAVASDDPEIVSLGGPDDILAAIVHAVAAQNPASPVSLALVSDAQMREMNRRYRGVDSTTDVLTFEGGDVAIAAGTLARQAAWRGVSRSDEAALLALHAALHLEGYDDGEPDDRAEMQAETKRRADALGIPCEDEWLSLPYDLEEVAA